jgi:hypothetical protein
MVDDALSYLIYGQPIVDGQARGGQEALALTADLSPDEVTMLRQRVPLVPLPVSGEITSQSVALVTRQSEAIVRDAGNEYVLARAYRRLQGSPIYQYVIVPGRVINRMGGDIQPLIQLIDDPLPDYEQPGQITDPLSVPAPSTWTPEKSAALLGTLMTNETPHNRRLLPGILAAALDKRGVLIRNFPMDWSKRLSLVRGLMTLLPTPARSHLTFITHTESLGVTLPRIVFSEAETTTERWLIDWSAPDVPDELLTQPYIAHLLGQWNGDVRNLVTSVQALDSLALNLMPGNTLDAGLEAVVTRHQQDLAVMQGQDMPAEEVITILSGEMPPTGDMRFKYVEHLLRQALHERDTDAAELVAQELDSDPALDERLWGVFEQVLEEQPDAVYVFVRTRLSEGIDDRWLKRLRTAAEKSLQVAIESGDPQTLASWLTLISREPGRYELGTVLREGLLEARERAAGSPLLAQELLTLAVKRQPDTLETLLADSRIMDALPDTVREALVAPTPQAINALANDERELFLLALHLAFEAPAERQPLISPTAARALRAIHMNHNNATLPPQFRPLTLLKRMAQSPDVLLPGTMETVLTHTLAASDDNLFFELAGLMADRDALAAGLVTILEQSERDTNTLLDTISSLVGNDALAPQQAVDTYVGLLSSMDWSEAAHPLAEQVARVLNQFPDTTAQPGVLWRIVELSGDLKSEQMLRVAAKRLLADMSDLASVEQLVEQVKRLHSATTWSQAGRSLLMGWWRDYARSQSLVQLQKLNRALEGMRSLEAYQAVIDTAIALRRVIGQRTLAQFADDISTAYTILQALAEGFDPDEKHTQAVDSATIRSEIRARAEELAPDERHVLATNLKELAQLMTSMSDRRLKPGMLRSDETIERQLVTGEQQPQSAIDVMRWLSGYLDGIQKDSSSG